MKASKWMVVSALSLALLACDRGDRGNSGSGSVTVTESEADQANAAHTQEILQWRNERLERLQKPDGWLSLVGLHWIEPGSTRVGSGPANGTRLSVGPQTLGMLTLKNGKAQFRIDARSETMVDGNPAPNTVSMVPDSQGEPTKISFNNGDASIVLIERSGRFALRVRNSMAQTRMQFPGLEYFDIDPAFKVKAQFAAHPAGQKIDIVNILGLTEQMDNPGTLTFELGGQSFTAEAIDEGDGQYFIVFADRTSGKESYAAARFVYAAPAGAEGFTEIDFNKAYNPPCAFTTYSTCPLPPAGNRFNVEIRAGEKKPLKDLKLES
jgi:uncharacterized protein